MEDFIKLIEEHEKKTFPSDCYGETNGINLMVLNSEITGRLLTLKQTGGKLSSRAKNELLQHQGQLESVIPALSDSSKGYFLGLLKLVQQVGLKEEE